MTIKVISQTTAERKEETKQLFKQVQPLLDEGYPLSKAVQKVTKSKHHHFYRQSWFKELRKYAESKGYKGKR